MSSRFFLSAAALGLAAAGLTTLAPAQAVKRALPVEAETPVPATPPLTPTPPVETPVRRAVPVEEMEPTAKPLPPLPALPVSPAKPEEPAKPAPFPPLPKLDESAMLAAPEKIKKDLEASWMTLKEARTLKLEVAAPRGQIVDRNGICLAQNRVVNYLALNFPVIDPPTDENVISFARTRISEVNRLLGKTWEVPNERIVQHYKDRRWLPLIFSNEGRINVELSQEEIAKLKPMLGKGLMLHPTFVRYYPKLDTACHVVGYTGIRQPLPTGVIVEGEPMIEEPIGKAGL